MNTFLVNLSKVITASTFDKEKVHFYPYQQRRVFEVFYPTGDLKIRLETIVNSIERFYHNRKSGNFQVIFMVDSFEQSFSIQDSLTFITQCVRKYFLPHFRNITNVFFINLDFAYNEETDFSELQSQHKKVVSFDKTGEVMDNSDTYYLFGNADLQQLDGKTIGEDMTLSMIFENFKTNIVKQLNSNVCRDFYNEVQEQNIIQAYKENKLIDIHNLNQRNISLKTSFKSLIQQYFSPGGNYLKPFAFIRIPFQPQSDPDARMKVIAFILHLMSNDTQMADNTFLSAHIQIDAVAYQLAQGAYVKKLMLEQRRLEEEKYSFSQKCVNVKQFITENIFVSDEILENMTDEFRLPKLFFIWKYELSKKLIQWIDQINPQLNSLFKRSEHSLSKIHNQFIARKPDEKDFPLDNLASAVKEKEETIGQLKAQLNASKVILNADDYQLSYETYNQNRTAIKQLIAKLPEKEAIIYTFLALMLLPIPFVWYHAYIHGLSVVAAVVASFIITAIIGMALTLILRVVFLNPIRKIFNSLSADANAIKLGLFEDFIAAKDYLAKLFVLKFENKNLQQLRNKADENALTIQRINYHITQLKNHKSHYTDFEKFSSYRESFIGVDIYNDIMENQLYSFPIDSFITEIDLVQDKIYGV